MKFTYKHIVLIVLLTITMLFSACSGSGQISETDNANEPVTESVAKTSGISPSPSAEMLTLDDIKKSYEDAEILSTTEIGKKFLLVEYQMDSFANRFDLYNLETGEVDRMPTSASLVTLKEIVNENYLIFEDSGKNSESVFSHFPYIIKCFRVYADSSEKDSFIAVYEDKYHELDKSVEAGSKSGIALSSFNVTFEGIEVMFKPSENDEGYFYVGTTDIPPTKTSYDSAENQFIIEIETELVDEDIRQNIDIYTDDNQYFSSYNIAINDGKTYITISLRAIVNKHLIQKGKAPDSGTIDGFPFFYVKYSGK